MTRSDQFAALYVRVSSEAQAEGASPDEQERDCRAVAEQHGLTVVKVYRDVERYRVKGKMVDPSGTRADRPGLVSMLADAAAGQFGTIIAWREDRLYRGMRAMINVLETIQEHRVTIILARETFDAKIAPLKAWVAGMELEGMKERMSMGVKARLRAGKANTGQDRYGYRREGERVVIVEEEARWVRQIFAWYIERVPMAEIRRRLIAAGAPQKGGTRPKRYAWSIAVIQGILKSAANYASGVKVQRRIGEAFEIPIEPIIDALTYRRAIETRANNKTFKADNLKVDYLIGGLLESECGKWQGHLQRVRRAGEERKTPTSVYRCYRLSKEREHVGNCPKTIGGRKADDLAWAKVVKAVDDPDLLIAGAQAYIDELRAKAAGILAEHDRLQRSLDEITTQRQWVITQARVGTITQADMEHQLAALIMQELSVRKDIADSEHVIDVAALGEWEGTKCGALK